MLPAIFGLIGVIVGGFLNGAVQWKIASRAERRASRAAARLVMDDLLQVEGEIDQALEDGVWGDLAASPPTLEAWTEHRTTLTSLPFRDWAMITNAVSFARNVLREIRTGGLPEDPIPEATVPRLRRLTETLVGAQKVLALTAK